MTQIYPVLLSGGSGSRLWPLSRSEMPKQLMPLVGQRSLFQETVLRLNGRSRIMPPVVISNNSHRFTIAAQLLELGIRPIAHVLEPEGRNTAPAVAVAVQVVADLDPEGILILLPTDHHLKNTEGFCQAVFNGVAQAEQGHLVTFGIIPDSPATGYGYIRQGSEVGNAAFKVASFIEKPSSETAKQFLVEGGYLWNSGIFIGRVDIFREEMQLHCPEILLKSRQAVAAGSRDLDFLRLDPETFRACASESFDTAVMEHTQRAVVVPMGVGWSDMGSWATLWELGSKDEDGNVISGDVIALNSGNSYISSESMLVATLGVRDLIVVEAGDAVLIAAKECAQDVKSLVANLKALGRREHDTHARVHRPWGFYELIEVGDRYQVKHLMVKPGASLSLQMHHHRAEHWVVVRGTARVTIKDKTRLIAENESTYIPIGATHRLENPGMVPLSIIEVQSGAYLGEDDIVRFEDQYGRVRHNHSIEDAQP